jgi:uncharacterized protein (DUF697 family)
MFNGAVGLWNLVRGLTTNEIRRQMELPISVVLVGDEEEVERLSQRLGSPSAQYVGSSEPLTVGPDRFVFDAKRLINLDDAAFAVELGKLASQSGTRKIALANAVPALRPGIAHQLSHDKGFENAKIAAISALPGVIPLTDWLMPVTSAGDLLVLTRNQIVLLLEVAACYGKSPEPKARLKELLPIVGSAFGWRTIARELVGLVPGGVGVIIKAAIAYAGTYSVGRAASYYYSGGTVKAGAEQMKLYYRGAFTDGLAKAKGLLANTKKT